MFSSRSIPGNLDQKQMFKDVGSLNEEIKPSDKIEFPFEKRMFYIHKNI